MEQSENIYKFVILATIAGSGIIRGYYELNYMKVELVKIYAGTREKFFVKFVGICIVLPVFIYVFTPWLQFAHLDLSPVLRLLASAVMGINLFYFLWIHVALGKNWSPILVISKDHQLITTGPYKHIRHPMYLSIFIHLYSMLFVSSNWVVGLVGIIAFSISYFIRIREEENMMIEQFGKAYTDYLSKTGRLFPKRLF